MDNTNQACLLNSFVGYSIDYEHATVQLTSEYEYFDIISKPENRKIVLIRTLMNNPSFTLGKTTATNK